MSTAISNHFPAFFVSLLLFCVLACNGPDDAQNAPQLKAVQTATATDTNSVAGALPFKMEFREMAYNTATQLPRLQSYAIAVTKNGNWIISNGRRQGLHTFKPAPAKNFIPDSSNNFLFLINPTTGSVGSFDVNQLPPSLSAPLKSTNPQFYYDRATDQLYLMGGYGWKADKSDMVTFNTLLRYNVSAMEEALQSNPTPQQIASLFEVASDDRYAVTGGILTKLNNTFYLVFGQNFMGQYRAFGGTDFKQTYTEEIRAFTLKPNTLQILSYGPIRSSDPDRPFHRRDGNIVEDVDPATGQMRIASFGGVFLPGVIGAYTYPVFIANAGTPLVVKTANQKFSQYECPVISLYDSSANSTVYHTFFGGISHHFYHQTDSQSKVYNLVTQEGRNDGFPFVADVSTFQQSADGTYKEFIHVDPTPNNRLVGSSVVFIPHSSIFSNGYAFPNGVLKMKNMPKDRPVLVGYVYGGVEAQNPLPLAPNTGTGVSNSVFGVYVTITPTAAIPADKAHESTKNDANLNRR